MAPPKAVLLITGAWHVPEHYIKVTSLLEKKGIRTICEQLPTNNNAIPPNKGIEDDVQFIKDIIAREVAKGTHLTVAAHSWGGMIATASCAEFAIDASSTSRGGVTSILYMAAFVPSENQSLADLFGGELPPVLTPMPDGTLFMADPIDHFYNDMPPEEAERAEGLRVANPTKAQYTPISCETAAWRVLPVSYMLCELDAGLPPAVQEQMVDKVRSEGREVKVYRVQASHSPFYSIPEKVVDIAMEVMDTY